MRYLKLTIQPDKRRVQIEQWLLLLVRIALPVLLFVLLARPLVNPTAWSSGSARAGGSVQVCWRRLPEHWLYRGRAPRLHRAREIAGSLLASTRPGTAARLSSLRPGRPVSRRSRERAR